MHFFNHFKSGFLHRAIPALLILVLAGCAGPGTIQPVPTSTPVQPSPVPPTPTRPAPTLTLAPTATPPAPQPVMLAGGAGHTCLLSGGQVRCWGAGQFGQLGAVVDGAFSVSGAPLKVKGLPEGVLDIAAGTYHTCALTSSQVLCWGQNDISQLGQRPAGDTGAPAPVAGVAGGLAIAAGGAHTCLVTVAGGVLCWGSGAGQPASVTGLAGKVRALALGYEFACALDEQGKVQCWGAGTSGQLGSGELADSPTPLQVSGLPAPARAIAAGAYHACALLEGGGVWCWGAAADADGARPAQITGLAGPVQALAAGDGHTCALLQDGAVQCWGDNYFGQLGQPGDPGTGLPSRGTPVSVAGLSPASALAAGTNHTCALLAGGSLRCWGDGSSGQLGDGSVKWK